MTELAAVGLAAAVVQFVGFSSKIVKRLAEFDSAVDNVPQSFRDIKVQLPLITDTLYSIKRQVEIGSINEDATKAAKAVIDSMLQEAQTLMEILLKFVPKEGSSNAKIRIQALKSLRYDSKAVESINRLLKNIHILNLYQSKQSRDAIEKLSEDILRLSSSSPPALPSFSIGLNIGSAPQIELGAFIGREVELEQLRELLTPHSIPHIQKYVAIVGMGGIGKTQLSLAFAKQYWHEYASVLWLNAKDEATLKASLVSTADIIFNEIHSSENSSVNEDRIIHQVREWFSRQGNDHWLLIFDNYDDPKVPGVNSPTGYDIRQYFPFRNQGSILITTRSRRLKFAQEFELSKIGIMEHSLKILGNRSRRNMEHDPYAVKLVNRLNGLPLALATAGTYLSQTDESVAEYLAAYETLWCELSENTEELLEYGDRTLFSTWNLSFAQVKARDPDAAELLRLLAYFGSRGIHYDLFRAGGNHQLPWLSALTENKRRFKRAMALLQEYSLVEVSASGYNLHSCVHDWTLHALNTETNGQYFWAALQCIASNVMRPSQKNFWKANLPLVVHAVRFEHSLFAHFFNAEDPDASHSNALAVLGDLWNLQADYTRAERLLQRALAGQEKHLGPDHMSTLKIVRTLGDVYYNQSKLSAAEKYYQRALRSFEQVLGPDHEMAIRSLGDLGEVYQLQDKRLDAQKIYQRALAVAKNSLDQENQLIFQICLNLGSLYHTQGKRGEAEEMFRQALTGYERVFGPDHPFTLHAVTKFGDLFDEQGRTDEAEEMYQRSLSGCEKSVELDGSLIIHSMYRLALLHMKAGRAKESEALFEGAILGYKTVLGTDSRETWEVVCGLGDLHRLQGRESEAERSYREAFEGLKTIRKIKDVDGFRITDVVSRLAVLYRERSQALLADQIYQEASIYLESLEKESEIDEPHSSIVVFELAQLYLEVGKLTEAEQKYKLALDGLKKVLGMEDLITLRAARELADLYRRQGKWTKAEQKYKQTLNGMEKLCGTDDPMILGAARELTDVCHAQGNIAEAEQLARSYHLICNNDPDECQMDISGQNARRIDH